MNAGGDRLKSQCAVAVCTSRSSYEKDGSDTSSLYCENAVMLASQVVIKHINGMFLKCPTLPPDLQALLHL